ncbi:hypothetical protein GO986_19395 [Deinococcus sp. HMF7620]|uniref:DoxX family protein n=1 Tax=Deinococcus arboris TaxID=2682977 RepID=A0A7C9I5E9_9DEIO|nr:hypothetical protein [Deinococcus arboris]MVN88911.1 hypothetical protein [Deinococcus arboris]
MIAMSPMGVLWRTVGISPLYQTVGGLAEILPGLLLLFRRTSLAGASIGLGVIGYVLLLNMSFDVPVKIFSIHLLMFCLILIFPYRYRLIALFSGRAAPAVAFPLSTMKVGLVWLDRTIRVVLLVTLLVLVPWLSFTSTQAANGQAVTHDMAGIYRVLEDSNPAQLQVKDDNRWTQIVLGDRLYSASEQASRMRAMVNTVSGERLLGAYLLNTSSNQLSVALQGKNISFDYIKLGQEVILQGTGDNSQRRLVLVRDTKDELLMTRGFHWISDQPFNR